MFKNVLCCTLFSRWHPVVVKIITFLTVIIIFCPLFCLLSFLSFILTFKSCYPDIKCPSCCAALSTMLLSFHYLHNTLPPTSAFLCVAFLLPSSIIQSSHTHSRDYAKPWLSHSKTPTPTKCHCCPDLGHTAAGHEVTHSTLLSSSPTPPRPQLKALRC